MSLSSILNNMKCPICNNQLDIYFKNKYVCVSNFDHYQVTLSISDYAIVDEKISIYDTSSRYVISKKYFTNGMKTTITSQDIDLEGRLIFSFEIKTLIVDYDCFDFKSINIDDFINRIKIMFTFQ
jgi:hypothetical protein